MKHVKRLLVTLVVLAATIPVPLARAQGGLVFNPYWTFETKTPVTHVETGDINGDGMLEVVIATADNWVYVLENDGDLAWRYETGFVPAGLIVDDLDGDGHAAEIIVHGENQTILLSDSERPVWTVSLREDSIVHPAIAIDLDGDGRSEGVQADNISHRTVAVFDATTGIYLGRAWHIGIIGQTVIDLWAGDIDGDGRPEIVPSPAGGRDVYVLDTDLFSPAWTQQIEGEVGLVQGGDVDGDGQAEVVVLGAAWDLFLLESDGSQAWHKQSISVENAPDGPVPGQLIVHDLNGDGTAEIVVLAPAPAAAVHVFDGDGNQVWQHSLDTISSAAKLTADDIDGDGGAEVVVTTVGQDQVFLLGNDGQRLAEYRLLAGPEGTFPASAIEGPRRSTGALDYADLNGDGWGEVIVGTRTGVQVFGTSNQVVPRQLWQSGRVQGAVSALYLGDVDGDSRAEVLAGSGEGRVYVLADERYIWREVDLGGAVLAMSAGDVDADGLCEVVVGTFGGVEARGGSPIHVLDSEYLLAFGDPHAIWSIPVRASFINSLAVRDLDDDGRSEIIAGGGRGAGGTVVLLEGHGDLIWQREFEEQVTTVGGDGGQVLPAPVAPRPGPDGTGQTLVVGTESGRVYRLTADSSTVGEYDLGAKVLGFGQGLAATADGRVYDLGDGGPSLVRELGGSPRQVQVDAESTVMLVGEGELSLVTRDEVVWQGMVDGRGTSIATGDLNGDGEAEVAVGTDQGRVHVFGLALDQPPMLTEPLLAETRAGYAYSVDVNDPEGDAVPITLEIWDPSAGAWMTQPAQSLGQGQERGRLVWEVAEPFDMWDSGQESRFRFSYDDGVTQGSLAEIPGPLTIPTIPWYIYYGQRVGLGVLILLVPALGLLLYRRQRAYRRSPVGQTEGLLRQLQASPSEALLRLHDLARHDPNRLAYMPSLAREASEEGIADLSEGFHLILIRPEVTAEDLRAIVKAIQSLNTLPGERATVLADLYQLLGRSLEANTVSRIVSLRSGLGSLGRTLDEPDLGLSEAAEALTNLGGVAQALRNYQRVDLIEDKTAYLAQAMESLSRLDREFRAKLPQPERNILSRIAGNWLIVTTNAFQDLQGRAQIDVSLKTRQLLSLEGATLSLELSNAGRSAASNLGVALLPGQGYTVSDGAAHLDILPAGRSALVELPVSVAPEVDQFRAEFVITFDDREREGKSLAFADIVHLLQPAAEFQPIANPYVPGTPLAPGSPIFFGREDLFQFIAENMAGLARQNILVLIGQRRMGKTSFLRQLPARLGPDYLPVYVDGQSLGIDPGMANFFYDLSLAIVDALADQGVEVEEPALEDFQEGPSRTFERDFLPVVLEAIGGRQLLLLFDEFEELELRVESGKLEPTIFSFFRHLMQHVEGLGFIFVGTHRLEALSSDYWSIFFNIALYKHVAFLDEKAARALIVDPVAEHDLLYDELAVDKMLRVTAGHPYFLQLTCHALVNHANRERRGYLTIQDVNDVLGEMVELGEAHFAFLWEQSGRQERLALAALTRLLSQEPAITAAQVAELLAERGVRMEARDAAGALRHLVERDIVREVRGQPPRYDYKVELVRLWVERSKALDRMTEETG